MWIIIGAGLAIVIVVLLVINKLAEKWDSEDFNEIEY